MCFFSFFFWKFNSIFSKRFYLFIYYELGLTLIMQIDYLFSYFRRPDDFDTALFRLSQDRILRIHKINRIGPNAKFLCGILTEISPFKEPGF